MTANQEDIAGQTPRFWRIVGGFAIAAMPHQPQRGLPYSQTRLEGPQIPERHHPWIFKKTGCKDDPPGDCKDVFLLGTMVFMFLSKKKNKT